MDRSSGKKNLAVDKRGDGRLYAARRPDAIPDATIER
jgi:hypothetical protein